MLTSATLLQNHHHATPSRDCLARMILPSWTAQLLTDMRRPGLHQTELFAGSGHHRRIQRHSSSSASHSSPILPLQYWLIVHQSCATGMVQWHRSLPIHLLTFPLTSPPQLNQHMLAQRVWQTCPRYLLALELTQLQASSTQLSPHAIPGRLLTTTRPRLMSGMLLATHEVSSRWLQRTPLTEDQRL